MESELSVLRNKSGESEIRGRYKMIDWLCERLNLPLPSRKSIMVMVGDMLYMIGNERKYEDGSYNYDHLFSTIRIGAIGDVALINQEVILGGRELLYPLSVFTEPLKWETL